MSGMNTLHAVILGVILSSTAVIGDLIESLFKREAGVKDSGQLFPGIGGILDLLDSLLFNAPIMYLYLRHILTHPSTSIYRPMKNVVLLGSTGSIGTSTVKVAEDLPDHIRLLGLAAGNNAELLLEQTRRHQPAVISINDPGQGAGTARRARARAAQVYCGDEGLLKLATLPEADIVLIAIVGTAGLQPALAAIRAGKDIAVASKEILVMAGEIVMSEARKYGVRVLAVDSEHSAIFQCLDGKPSGSVRKLWLTASGGPFRDKTDWPKEKFPDITVERALKHPSWVMGRKITIDSATLFNKGLEMIEARWLFDIEMARVGVVVHPQSIVHSMVEFVDGSLLAQLSTPDMCLPIQYALTYPDRAASDRVQTNFAKLGTLTFEEPDVERFPGA